MTSSESYKPRERARPGNTRRWLLLLALLCLIFIVHGSLVPWELVPLSFSEAWTAFLHNVPTSSLPLESVSRTDWSTNVLLPIPLAFFLLGAVWPRYGMAARLFLTVFVWLVCLVVSFGVEFAQVFAVSRVSSASDILAQAIGSVVGLALWWWKGEASLRWFQEWQHARGRTVLAERVLWAYLVLLFAFNVLPLDLTISPVELYHKWKAGRIIFIPFSYPMETWADGLYGLIVDVLTWVPISLLALLSGRKTGAQAWRMTVLAALLLEGLQLIVYSRVTDTTDVLTAMVGAQVGIWLGRRLTKYSPEATPPRADGQRSIMLGVIGYLVWLLVLAIVFWYPFEFTRDPQLLKARLNGLVTMPFYNYFYSTQLRAATEVVHKVAFFIPLGVILSFSRRAFTTPSARTLVDAVALTALLAAAAFVELGQVALPAKYPDITDWVLESAGAVIGYFAASWTLNRIGARPDVIGSRNMPRGPVASTQRQMPPEPSPSASRYEWLDD